MKDTSIKTVALYAVMGVYSLLLLRLLVFRYASLNEIFSIEHGAYRPMNLVPFYSITGYLTGRYRVTQIWIIENLIGNIVLFIPFGVLLQLFSRNKDAVLNFLTIMLVTVTVEVVQYILGVGAADVDDVILNCIGGIIGILGYKVLRLIIRDEQQARTVVLMCAVLVLPLWFLYSLSYM